MIRHTWRILGPRTKVSPGRYIDSIHSNPFLSSIIAVHDVVQPVLALRILLEVLPPLGVRAAQNIREFVTPDTTCSIRVHGVEELLERVERQIHAPASVCLQIDNNV
jgi:hypothetical protein